MKIKCAAIRMDNLVCTGKNHAFILYHYPQEYLLKWGIQGFLTDEEPTRFVSREEAAKIAFEAGQVPTLKSELFSEDLPLLRGYWLDGLLTQD